MIHLRMLRSRNDAKYEFILQFDTDLKSIQRKEVAEFMQHYPEKMIEYNPDVEGHLVPNWRVEFPPMPWSASAKLLVNDEDLALYVKLSCNM